MNIDPIFIPGIIITGLVLFGYLLSQSIKKPVIPYLLIQFTIVWIFFGQKILGPVGLDFKPHAAVFLLATLVSFYFIFRNFNELWSYKPFRYLFVFFLISTVYALFYKTDFRSSSYIDLWIHGNLGLKHSAIKAGHGAVTREFGSAETKYIVYLAGLAPLVAFLTGFMSFKGFFNKLKLQNLISIFSLGALVYFIFLGISILAGTSTIMFMEGRLALDGSFTGGDFEGLFLILFVGFYLYLQKNRDFKFYEPTKWSLLVNIIILSGLILLGIKRGTILSLFIALHAVVYLMLGIKLYTTRKLSSLFDVNFNPLIIIIPAFLVVIPMVFSPEFFETTVDTITERFETTDTLDVRVVNWELYNQHWLNNLSFLKALFGFGIDRSREAIFFLSAMHPDPSMQQPHIHNIYLEMFYNYGLMAVLFFLPFIIILFNNFKEIITNRKDETLTLFNSVSITAISFFLVYYMAESPAVPSIILIFSMMGFLESLRRSIYEQKKENPVPN